MLMRRSKEKMLDLSLPYRLTGLSNCAKLCLVQGTHRTSGGLNDFAYG